MMKLMNHQCCNPNTPVIMRNTTSRLKMLRLASSKTFTSFLLLWLRKKLIPSMAAAMMKLWVMMIIFNGRWITLIVRQQLSWRSGSQHKPVTVMRGWISILWYGFLITSKNTPISLNQPLPSKWKLHAQRISIGGGGVSDPVNRGKLYMIRAGKVLGRSIQEWWIQSPSSWRNSIPKSTQYSYQHSIKLSRRGILWGL